MKMLKKQMSELQEFVYRHFQKEGIKTIVTDHNTKDFGSIYYSGRFQSTGKAYHWEPQEKSTADLINMNGDKMSKVLVALGNKQRLDILRALLREPLTGAELVERLNMGTTGQLYHHIKALLGANLVVQEHGGPYTIPNDRVLPFLLLLTGVSELIDASNYITMMEARDNAGDYLGKSQDKYDAQLLLWAILENSLLEHAAGYCSEVHIFLHRDGSATLMDNGRGIPTRLLPQTNTPMVQSVLTDIDRLKNNHSFVAPGAEKGINIAVVNALSQKLHIEIRREGQIFRQEYKYGIPQTGLMEVGVSNETGTSITFNPDPELFNHGFDRDRMEQQLTELTANYPNITIQIHG